MAISYTVQERKRINAAWSDLLHFADCHRVGDSRQLQEALRAERAEVSDRAVSKALLLRTLADACDEKADSDVNTLSEMWALRRSHRDLVAYAHFYNGRGLADSDVLVAAREVADVHHRAFDRAVKEA